MKLLERSGKAAAVILSLAFLFPALASADTTSFTAVQTVANVSTANTQTLATSSSVGNTAQTKASRTITVATVPATAVTLTVGNCVITVTGTITSDVSCSDNIAAIATTTDTTAAAIAARIRTITGLTDNVNGHGALTIGSSSADVSFTTTGTEASSTVISASQSSGSNFTLAVINTAGVVPVAQVWTATPANVDIGDTFTANINGTVISYVATAGTVANVTAGLTAAINASAQAPVVTAVDGTTLITVTSDVPGTAFTLTTSATNGSAVAQTVVFTPTTYGSGDTFTLVLNGTSYTYIVLSSDTVKELVEGLVSTASANSAANCSEDDIKITCVAKVAGTSFSYDTAVVAAARASSHHSGGGGGGSSRPSSSPSTTTGDMTTTTTTTTSGTTSVSPAAWPVMTKGATGASVSALQTWLIAKGYSIPAGATGYFGAQTTAALAAYQKASGISPAVGYFGPITRAYIAAHL